MEENEDENRVLKEILEWSFCIVLAVFVALTVRFYIVTSSVVKQESMYSTLEENQRVILSRLNRTKKNNYERGDIVTFEAPSEIKQGTDVDTSNLIAIYNYEPEGKIDRFIYYVLEIGKVSYIKRIIGVEGDLIQIIDGEVYLNGEKLKEEYLQDGVDTKAVYYNELIVPEGCVYVMGDNRNESMDSRIFGCIPIEKIEGKVIVRYWPLSRFGKV